MLVGLKPSGAAYMEDFYRAGGMPVVLQALREQLQLDALTVSGATLGEQLAEPFAWPAWQDVIRPLHAPHQEQAR